jgi:hypothetical protein
MPDDRPLSMPEPSGARINANGTVSLRPATTSTAAGRIREWLRRVGQRGAAEHVCEMPPGFTAVASCAEAHGANLRSCPECAKVFAGPRLRVIAGGGSHDSDQTMAPTREVPKSPVPLRVVKS